MKPNREGCGSAFVTLLVVLFGTGSWITIAGIWTEVPVLIAHGIPEEYRLNSYLVAVINLGFVGIVVFLAVNFFAPRRFYRPEIPANYAITACSLLGTFLLMFFWDSYSVWSVDGHLHATAFLLLTLCISFVDIMSNVTFVAFMSLLKPKYLNWFWVGQGSSALIPGLLSLIQNSGSDMICVANYTFMTETVIGNETFWQNCTTWEQRGTNELFGPKAFFGCLFVIAVLCHLSFIGLNTLPCAKSEYATDSEERRLRHDACGGLCDGPLEDEGETLNLTALESQYHALQSPLDHDHVDDTPWGDEQSQGRSLSRLQFAYLYTLMFLDFFLMYGIFSSVQSFSASAYGHRIYTLIVALREIVKVVAFFLFLCRPVYSFPVTAVTFLVGSIAGIYCLAVAIMSPNPPFQGQAIGKALIVAAWLCEGLFMNYCKAAIAWILRHTPNSRKHMIGSGIVAQMGVLAGAILMFPLINVVHILKSTNSLDCPDVPVCESSLSKLS